LLLKRSLPTLSALYLALTLSACASNSKGTEVTTGDNSNAADAGDDGTGQTRGDGGKNAPPPILGDGDAGTTPIDPPVPCGDGALNIGEDCDDGNTIAGDGCSQCMVDMGWICPPPGTICLAKLCGDGIIAGKGALGEECDDKNRLNMDGCDSDCKIEEGWVCSLTECHETACGDGKVEGKESCEDGNDFPFDTCANCQIVPQCNIGPCMAVCGDSMIFPEESCDDGNAIDGDGCDHTCQIEAGYKCESLGDQLGDTLSVAAVFRDFIMKPSVGHEALSHPDFAETVGSQGISSGMVADTLDATGHPVYTGHCEKGTANVSDCKGDGAGSWQTHTKALWDQWYQGGPLASQVVSSLTLSRTTGSTFSYAPATDGFFPVDNNGWVKSGEEIPDPGCSGGHNFGFTSEVHDWFTFMGGESLTFSGDDDVWVFVGGKLALDLGGVHGQETATITLQADGSASCSGECASATRALGLTVGHVYQISLFHAERRGCGANFRLDLAGFSRAKSKCSGKCGDGIVTAGEECDDGNANDQDSCSNACKVKISVD
jgi:fibro-slime domain-containing protein